MTALVIFDNKLQINFLKQKEQKQKANHIYER